MFKGFESDFKILVEEIDNVSRKIGVFLQQLDKIIIQPSIKSVEQASRFIQNEIITHIQNPVNRAEEFLEANAFQPARNPIEQFSKFVEKEIIQPVDIGLKQFDSNITQPIIKLIIQFLQFLDENLKDPSLNPLGKVIKRIYEQTIQPIRQALKQVDRDLIQLVLLKIKEILPFLVKVATLISFLTHSTQTTNSENNTNVQDLLNVDVSVIIKAQLQKLLDENNHLISGYGQSLIQGQILNHIHFNGNNVRVFSGTQIYQGDIFETKIVDGQIQKVRLAHGRYPQESNNNELNSQQYDVQVLNGSQNQNLQSIEEQVQSIDDVQNENQDQNEIISICEGQNMQINTEQEMIDNITQNVIDQTQANQSEMIHDCIQQLINNNSLPHLDDNQFKSLQEHIQNYVNQNKKQIIQDEIQRAIRNKKINQADETQQISGIEKDIIEGIQKSEKEEKRTEAKKAPKPNNPKKLVKLQQLTIPERKKEPKLTTRKIKKKDSNNQKLKKKKRSHSVDVIFRRLLSESDDDEDLSNINLNEQQDNEMNDTQGYSIIKRGDLNNDTENNMDKDQPEQQETGKEVNQGNVD
ncbi:MAG: hypothetical protein EZS28_028532 [Streblomastix strix]|uniref:Uncharacterized protein n=1 Tax=Streblomastix strix TaxID=222440 RepID=A0A5J4V1M5_9EUKA|nr:MAG: hypothetical protein EZS28_028532 [Streblomastix strix]